MAHRKTNLKISNDDITIKALVRLGKLSGDDVVPEIVRRDKKTGHKIKSQTYDKDTGEAISYGRRYVSAETEEIVPKERIEHYQVMDDGEEHGPLGQKFESTVGSDKTMDDIKWIDKAEKGEYLINKTYEIWGEEDEDVAELYELAQYIDETGNLPVVEFIWNASYYKSFGILYPYYDDNGEFSILMGITKKKIEPHHEMEKLTEDEIKEEVEGVKAKQEDPF